MAFKLSTRSKGRLNGVHPLMKNTVERAITLTRVDFGVTEGLRSLSRQRQMIEQGRSRTMKSYHLPQDDGYGHAVDLVAYIDGEICWDLALYDDIADAMKQAAKEYDAPIRWGAAWHINDITEWNGTMEEAMNSYIDLRRSQGRRPFIDGPHFELRI
jgi:peptidoglycan LD-endopeptidase CwlK